MVCGAFVIGDHLAFQTTVDATIALPMVVGKLAGGIFAAVLAFIITKSLKENG
jgi:ethanolamine transporter